jgi:uncharacterized protein DUF2591
MQFKTPEDEAAAEKAIALACACPGAHARISFREDYASFAFQEPQPFEVRSYVGILKPLHVRVAEALGCKPVQATDPDARRRAEESGLWGACWCANEGYDKGPHSNPHSPLTELARYDTDWSATGPLIEKYGIDLQHVNHLYWQASRLEDDAAPTDKLPLIAVCYLILALKEAGKL